MLGLINNLRFDRLERSKQYSFKTDLENLINAAADKDLLLPLNFGAKGSAQIGGAVSANAGGLRVFRYGMTRQMVLGIEAVLPDGKIISSLKKIIKDNSGNIDISGNLVLEESLVFDPILNNPNELNPEFSIISGSLSN